MNASRSHAYTPLITHALHPPPTPQKAAEAGSQWALFIKLSNNMGAVLRRMENHAEVRGDLGVIWGDLECCLLPSPPDCWVHADTTQPNP
jgi:hypothetical protein